MKRMLYQRISALAAVVGFVTAAPLKNLAAAQPARNQQESQGSEQMQAAQPPVIRLIRDPDPAPVFAVKGMDGNTVSLEAARGKVILLNFWATWCGPCRMEVPDLVELQNKYKDRLQVIGLVVDDPDEAAVRTFAKTYSVNYPVAMATDEMRVQFGGVPALPTSFIIDAQGRVVQKHIGLRDPVLYEMEIRALLGLPIAARVETFVDTGEVFLKHADRASELPGVDMTHLTAAQKTVALHRMNQESCACGCKYTLAQCRIFDQACPISKARTGKIVEECAAVAPDVKPENVPAAAPGSASPASSAPTSTPSAPSSPDSSLHHGSTGSPSLLLVPPSSTGPRH